jgi:hypothetical protein
MEVLPIHFDTSGLRKKEHKSNCRSDAITPKAAEN